MNLTVTLIANAGILLEYEGTTILVDGLFQAENAVPFSDPPPHIFDRMLQGEPPFQKIDYLLFTHNHIDHFSPEMAKTYLNRRFIKGVFLPSATSRAEEDLLSYMTEQHIAYTSLAAENDGSIYPLSPKISLQVMKTRHLDHIYYDVPHFCFCLILSGRHFLITADLDYTNESLPCLDRHLQGAFINPLFFHALHDPVHFRGNLDAEQIFIYHLPFEKDDRLNFRQLVARDLSLWSEIQPSPFVLSEPMQTITLKI